MIDFYEKNIIVHAGNGGNGCLSFSKNSRIFNGKPDGGNGGNGGNIFIKSNKNINNLFKLKNNSIFKAENGKNGLKKKCNGKNGKNLFIDVPVNTKILNYNTYELIDYLNYNNKSLLIAKGGSKGLGNFIFKSSINRSPKKTTNGKNGEIRKLKLIIELNSNICILGDINSGKSSLINLISNLNSKTDSYSFTTKYFMLGKFITNNCVNLSILDTPSYIYKNNNNNFNIFKHLKSCDLLLYIVDSSINFNVHNINLINNINIINNNFLYKDIWIIFNKLDLINNIYYFKKKINHIIYKKYKYYLISCLNKFNINNLIKDINFFFK